jgi:hypothetical protein
MPVFLVLHAILMFIGHIRRIYLISNCIALPYIYGKESKLADHADFALGPEIYTI